MPHRFDPPAAPLAPRGVSVVIPCLNEVESIAAVVAAAASGIQATGLPGEVIVVDNGSTDGSAEQARAAGAQVVGEACRGYGAAIRRGFAAARYEYLVMGDGDCSYDLSGLPAFVELLAHGEADLVVGNRWGDMRAGAMPLLHRYLGNPLLSFILRVFFRVRNVRDMHCGMRALRRSRWLQLGCVTEGMEFASEMIVRAARVGLRMREIPIAYHPRVGDSKLSTFADGWRHLRFMLLHSPTWVLLVPGVLLWVASLALLVVLAIGEVSIRGRVFNVHTMLVAAMLNVTSLQMLTMWALAKAYAHFAGLRRDQLIEWFYANFTFERVFLVTAPLVLGGVVLVSRVVADWAIRGFGPFDEAKTLLLGVLLVIDGSQIWASGYLLSIMALPRPRHHDTDSRPYAGPGG